MELHIGILHQYDPLGSSLAIFVNSHNDVSAVLLPPSYILKHLESDKPGPNLSFTTCGCVTLNKP